MENVLALNKAGSYITSESYRNLEVLEVVELFEIVSEMIKREQKEMEKHKNNR